MRLGQASPENITLAELLRAEPLRGVQMHALAGLDRVVDEVRLVDDVEQVRAARPGTVVVLQHRIARTAWSTAIAVRYAWERNARAVICALDMAAAPSAITLAERLSVPLGIHRGDLPALALELSAIVAQPEASRAQVVARCAELIAQQDKVEAILQVVEAELPGVRVTLILPSVAEEAPGTAPSPSIRVPMGPLDVRAGRELLATLERASVAWAGTVRAVLEIARAQIIACEAGPQLRLAHRRRLEEWTLRQLLQSRQGERADALGTRARARGDGWPSPEARTAAERLGWRIGPRVVAGMIVPLDPQVPIEEDLDLAVAGAWPRGLQLAGPVRHGGGWALWLSFDRDEADDEVRGDASRADRRAQRSLVSVLRRCLAQIAVGVSLVAGAGIPTHGGALGTSLRHAELAARVARQGGEANVVPFARVGGRAYLAATDTLTLRELAVDTLAPLLSLDDRTVLAQTLAAYLDCGGSTGRTAELLAVHRNTVSGRIDRIRRLGLDLDDPVTRLGIHMAAHLLGT